jgi:hypothetical protein
MIRYCLIVFGCCLGVCPASAQNLIGAEPQSQSIEGIIGQGNVIAGFIVNGFAVGVGNTNVKFQLASV